jgi:hypothetical protein
MWLYFIPDMRQFEGSPLYDETKARQKMFEDEFNSILQLTSQFPNIFSQNMMTFAVFKSVGIHSTHIEQCTRLMLDLSTLFSRLLYHYWFLCCTRYARLVVQTRAFVMHIDGKEVLGLVPFADMLNHKDGAKVKWEYNPATRRFHLFSGEPYAAVSYTANCLIGLVQLLPQYKSLACYCHFMNPLRSSAHVWFGMALEGSANFFIISYLFIVCFMFHSLSQGTQVYNNYGQRTNRRLLLDFG